MKPYGMDRRTFGDDDCQGIKANGRKTSLGHLPGPGGKARASQKSVAKKAARRCFKHRARAAGRRASEESP